MQKHNQDRDDMYALFARQLRDDGHRELAAEVENRLGVVLDTSVSNDYLFGLLSQTPNNIILEEQDKEKAFPEYTTRFVTTHKSVCRCSVFSSEGDLVATGSQDNSVKLLDVNKMHYNMQVKDKSGSVVSSEYESTRPVIRTLYDHQGAINDVVFHPWRSFVISASQDCTVKFFEYSRSNTKRAFRHFRETSSVRSISIHPSGDYILAGTTNVAIRLYDIASLQAYTTTDSSGHHSAAINAVRFHPQASVFASCSKDGSLKVWDGNTFQCARTIIDAHAGESVSSLQFSQCGRFLLSSGRDSSSRLWDVGTGKQLQIYEGAVHSQFRLQSTFAFGGAHILGCDETSSSIVVWDTTSGKVVDRVAGHNKMVRWVSASPTEPAFMSCSEDHRARFWAVDKDP